MWGFFDARASLEFARTVVEEYGRLKRNAEVTKASAARLDQRLDQLLDKVAAFSREQRLNFYKKARMIDAIRKGLLAHGVPAAEAEAFTQGLAMTALRRAR